MIRKLALVLGACLCLAHGSAWALGLGEIEVRSALNERFSAEIELRRIEGLSENEIIATLASADDFARLGVQRFFYLSELEFSTDLSEPGRPRIRISSSRPINEPFVNFVVDVRWPTGRLLREYTVLLDPPTYARQPAPAPRVAEPAPPAAREPAREPTREPTRVRTEPRPAAPTPAAQQTGQFDGETYGVTGRNDTLWAIALQVRPSSAVSAQQTMLALQRLNPDAFIGGNINLLKAGYVLRVPDRSEIERLSRQDAVVQVAEHNERWQRGTPQMPLDARPAEAPGERPVRPTGELRLVAGEDDETRIVPSAAPGTGAAPNGAMDELRADLAAAEERAARAEEARTAAQRRLDETTAQVEELSRQIELRNQELARLQQQLAEQAAPTTPRAAAEAPFGLSWVMLGGILAAVVLLLVGLLALMRRRRDEEDFAVAAAGARMDARMERTHLMPAVSQEDVSRAGAGAAGLAAASAVQAQAAPADGDGESDVIAEADVYMAYGRFGEAARVLESAIEQEGQRADLRLKLMEVQIETQDVAGFNAQAEALRSFADDETIALADDLAARLPGAVTSTGQLSEGASAASARTADAGELNLDFDLGEEVEADLDSLDIDLEVSNRKDAGAAADDLAEVGAEAAEEDLSLALGAGTEEADDFEFEFDKALAAESGQDAAAADEADLDLALDLEGDDDGDATRLRSEPVSPDLAAALETDAEAELEAGDDLEFDLELPPESAAAPRADAADAEFNITNYTDEPFETETGVAERTDLDLSLSSETVAELESDPEFDLDSDDADVALPSAATGDDDIDFALDHEAPAAGADANEDFASTIHRAPGADEGELTSTAQRAPGEDDSHVATLGRDVESDGEQPALSTTLARPPVEEPSVAEQPAGEPAGEAVEDEAPALAVDLADDDLELELDLGDVGDETSTKLELARAYIDMGDEDGAREILDEVVRDGSETQQQEAGELLARLG